MKKGWLLHDKLTCIPGTKTFWHDLLEWIPGLEDKTNNGELGDLPDFYSQQQSSCDYIIRNATYWPWIETDKHTISILQDIRFEPELRRMQIEVCNKSDIVVAVSNYVAEKYQQYVSNKIKIIPIGVDYDLFKPDKKPPADVLPNSILWIGDVNAYPKGFDLLSEIIQKTDYNFCVVLKSNKIIEHPRVRSFSRVDHTKLVNIMQQCEIALVTSVDETLHLASLEAAACNLPIITSNVGAYYNWRGNNSWGTIVDRVADQYISEIECMKMDISDYSPRACLEPYFSTKAVKQKWQQVISSLT